MFRLGADLKVYLHREPIDFRAGINSLAVLVQETMALDPCSGGFCVLQSPSRPDEVPVLRSVGLCAGPEAADRGPHRSTAWRRPSSARVFLSAVALWATG